MIQQRTKEWFEQRKGRITGSKVGAILGLSPFATRDDVMREMVREYHGAPSEFTGNVATDWGTAMEPMAISDFELESGLTVEPAPFVTCQHWLGASPDGYIGCNALIEIKCPYGKRDTGAFISVNEQPHYYAQIQVQLLVTARQLCYFYQWSSSSSKTEVIHINFAWIDENLPKLYAFYQQYLVEIQNPEKYLRDKKPTLINDEAEQEYLKAKEEFEQAKNALEDAKNKLIALANGQTCKIGSLSVIKCEKQGAISYAKALKKLCPDADLEPYRGKPSEYWSIK